MHRNVHGGLARRAGLTTEQEEAVPTSRRNLNQMESPRAARPSSLLFAHGIGLHRSPIALWLKSADRSITRKAKAAGLTLPPRYAVVLLRLRLAEQLRRHPLCCDQLVGQRQRGHRDRLARRSTARSSW